MLEAEFVLKLLKDKQLEYPVYFDIEEKAQVKLPKEVCDSIVTAFCSKLEKSGYWAGVYSFDSFFAANLSTAIVQKYTAWTARVENIKPTYCKAYGMHQYSWRGLIPGINCEVDMNYCFKDFPALIKGRKLNGFDKCTITATKVAGQAEAIVWKSRLEADGYTVNIA